MVTDACFKIQFSSKDLNWALVVAAVGGQTNLSAGTFHAGKLML